MSFYPNNRQEKRLLKKGFALIAGIDEVGKGAWAGPIVAAAVILNPKIKIKGVKDSKLLRAPDRQILFNQIVESAIAWTTAAVSQTEIDRLGIKQANILVIQKALKKMRPQPDYLLIDAIKIDYQNLPSSAIIDGDYKITSVAAASIIAKVTRDKMMDELAEKYPAYGFKQHKGYGTSHHFQMIVEHGICQLHRKTWQPMRYFLDS